MGGDGGRCQMGVMIRRRTDDERRRTNAELEPAIQYHA